ncbi:hypothetical protein A2U01_0029282, partial [Trifolium medium]|nr:hypothetical protein [Trifolium medium]
GMGTGMGNGFGGGAGNEEASSTIPCPIDINMPA